MSTEDIPLIMYTFPKHLEDVQKFFTHYLLEEIVLPPATARTKFPPYEKRVCRFCKRNSKETSFKTDSHVIPHALGNKYLVADDECDQCNKLFSTYENCLVDYLGIHRTVFSSRGKKNKVPKFKSPDSGLTASNTHFQTIEKAIIIEDNNGSAFDIDDVSGKTTINYKKHSYIPIFVYKALLKVALSLIKDTYLPVYTETIKMLITDHSDKFLSSFAKVGVAYTSLHMKTHCLIFRKQSATEAFPTHVFQLYYENLVFQLFIPLNKEDCGHYGDRALNINYCPPIFFQPVAEDEKCSFEILDLSGTQKIKETGTLSMMFDPEATKNLSAMNPFTGEVESNVKFNPKNIAKIMLVPSGASIPIINNSKKS